MTLRLSFTLRMSRCRFAEMHRTHVVESSQTSRVDRPAIMHMVRHLRRGIETYAFRRRERSTSG